MSLRPEFEKVVYTDPMENSHMTIREGATATKRVVPSQEFKDDIFNELSLNYYYTDDNLIILLRNNTTHVDVGSISLDLADLGKNIKVAYNRRKANNPSWE